jgi:hypothetical protein
MQSPSKRPAGKAFKKKGKSPLKGKAAAAAAAASKRGLQRSPAALGKLCLGDLQLRMCCLRGGY